MSKILKLGNYKGIPYSLDKVTVSDEEVSQQIQMILSQSNSKVEKEGDTVENGDIATINFVGLKDGVAFEGGTGNDYDLEIGSGTFIPGFEEQMIGMKVNETRDLNLTFPENYGAADLAGQAVVFQVTVTKLSVKKEPELNDEFVTTLGVEHLQTVADLNDYIRQGLQQQHDQDAQVKAENAIFDAFMADSDVELDDDDIMAMHVILDYENEKVGTGRMKFDGETFILDKMAVLKEHRNNGYGEFIVRMLLDKVFLANGKEIFTDATKDTVEFFKKIGFVEIGDEYEKDKLIYVPMKVQKGSVKTKCGGH